MQAWLSIAPPTRLTKSLPFPSLSPTTILFVAALLRRGCGESTTAVTVADAFVNPFPTTAQRRGLRHPFRSHHTAAKPGACRLGFTCVSSRAFGARLRDEIESPLRTRMSTSMSSFADGEEIVIPCSDGIKLAAKYWKPFPGTTGTAAAAEVPTHRIVCLHGWLDNAASFHLLAPAVHSRLSHGNGATSVTTPSPAVHVLALDLPGHGLSSHKSPDGPTSIMSEYALYLAEALTSLRWIPRPDDAPDPNPSPNPDPTPPITLIGHSMGTAVALIYAAAFPEHVRRVVLLDGSGPLHRPAEDVSTHVRTAVRRRISSNPTAYHDGGGSTTPGNARPGNGVGRRYPTFAHAVALRRRAATVLPGNQSLSESAAGAIVSRSTTAVGDGSVRFRHDPRLHLPSLHYFTPGQVEAVYRDVRCPVCLLGAEEGFPPPSPGYLDAVERVLAPEVRERLEGSHHFHADPETAGAVVDEVVRFLE